MPVVLISGGTGLIGTKLTTHLTERGYDVIVLSRNKEKASKNPAITYSYWDVKKKILDDEVIKKADHIIHLAGAGVMDKKWTEEYKNEIVESRTKSSALLINSLKSNANHVQSFVSASAIGWYGEDKDPLIRKDGFIETDPADKSFLGETCLLWESSVDPVKELGIKLVKLRTGIVLSNDGGAFKEFKLPVKFGAAGILGNGRQAISWIHIDDMCRLYVEAIENKDMHGVYNAVAPSPVTNKQLVMSIAKKFRNTFYIPVHVPEFLLKIMMGKRSVEILKSATVSAKKIKATRFTFLYPTIDAALNDLVKK